MLLRRLRKLNIDVEVVPGPAPRVPVFSFAGTGDDAIYMIDVKKGSAVVLINDQALRWPSGLLADEPDIRGGGYVRRSGFR